MKRKGFVYTSFVVVAISVLVLLMTLPLIGLDQPLYEEREEIIKDINVQQETLNADYTNMQQIATNRTVYQNIQDITLAEGDLSAIETDYTDIKQDWHQDIENIYDSRNIEFQHENDEDPQFDNLGNQITTTTQQNTTLIQQGLNLETQTYEERETQKTVSTPVLEFDGTSDYMETSSEIDLGTSEWTVASWYYPKASDDYGHIFTSSSDQGNFATKISQDLFPYFYSTDGRTESSDASESLDLDQWQHLAYVYDGSSIKIFLDGTKIVDESLTGLDIPSDQYLVQGGNSEFVNAKHDDVRIYDIDLSQTEVQRLNEIRYRSDVASESLRGWWAMNEAQDGTVGSNDEDLEDFSGNNNHGNNQGAEWEWIH